MPETTRNPYRGEVMIELADGGTRRFHFNLSAVILAQKKLAELRGDHLRPPPDPPVLLLPMEVSRVMIWAGFQKWAEESGQSFTIQMAGDLLEPAQLSELLAAINEAKHGPGEKKAGGAAEVAAAKESLGTGESS